MMRKLIPSLTALFLAACGSSSNDSAKTSTVNFGLSDAPVENLSSVVVTVESMTLQTASGEDILVDEFYNSNDPAAPLAQFQIDLLDYQGDQYRIISKDLELEVGAYQSLTLDILDEDVSNAYVEELDGAIKPIKVPSDRLKLGGFTVDETGLQTFIVEFDLRQSMTYNPGPDRYILKPRGVRIVEAAASSTVSGVVDLSFYNAIEPCANKTGGSVGNVIYLYEGHDLDEASFTDQLDPDLSSNGITTENNPFTSITLDDLGQYEIAFLPPGDYTLVFSCVAENDDPDVYDNLAIPAPDNTILELTLSAGETKRVNIPQL